MTNIIFDSSSLHFTEVLSDSIYEIGLYLLQYFIVILLFYLARKSKRQIISYCLILLVIFSKIYIVYQSGLKSEFIFSLCLALLVVGQIFLLNMFSLSLSDYALFFSLMFFPYRLFNTTIALLGSLWLVWIPFLSIYTVVRFHNGRFTGNHFACYFCSVISSFSCIIYYHVCFLIPDTIPGRIKNYGFYVAGTAVCTLFLFWLLTGLVKKFFYDKLLRLNQLGKKYSKVERYFPCFSLLILCLFTLITVPFSILLPHNVLILLLIPFLCILLLCAQIPFIITLYQASFYKDSATFHAWETENLASYYQDLSMNLTSMQEMRHDMKNIFFTMGTYVDRSEDEEMKEFFWQKIYPYSLQTIQQNELLSKLYQIPVEALRAFLHLKISQILTQKVSVNLEVNIVPENFQTGIDIIDLTRILGILLDNALEETTQIPDGTVTVKISGNAASCSYIIKNPITEQTKKTGISIGSTSKGSGHGNGLRIVHQLLSQYHNAVLNTSIQKDICIQCLNVGK